MSQASNDMTGVDKNVDTQRRICATYRVPFWPSPGDMKVGIARSVRSGDLPVHGLRHAPEGDTTGWYIWTGEMSDDPDFFVPLHIDHLVDWCPGVIPYLGLAPGWRFLLGHGHADVWNDPTLL